MYSCKVFILMGLSYKSSYKEYFIMVMIPNSTLYIIEFYLTLLLDFHFQLNLMKLPK